MLIFSASDVGCPWRVSLSVPFFCISLLSVVVTDKDRDHRCSSKARPQPHRVHKQCLVQGGMLRIYRGNNRTYSVPDFLASVNLVTSRPHLLSQGLKGSLD